MSMMEEATATKNVDHRCTLRGRGLNKCFGQVQALVDTDIEVFAGDVLAMVGDNGAGKSTLIKILCGVHQPDKGQIEIQNKPIKRISSPKHALNLGIAPVFQDLALVNNRDAASNVFLGHEPVRFKFFVDKATMFKEARAVLDQLRIAIPSLAEEVGRMSGGQRQTIAISRALSLKSHTVVMDEPTAALGVKESRQVLEVINQLKDKNVGLVVVSHNLLHVFSIADRIMVMRQGTCVGIKNRRESSIEEIEKMIIGA